MRVLEIIFQTVKTQFPQWENDALTHSKYREIGDWMRTRFGKDSGRVQQMIFVERLSSHGSRRASVKVSAGKISSKL